MPTSCNGMSHVKLVSRIGQSLRHVKSNVVRLNSELTPYVVKGKYSPLAEEQILSHQTKVTFDGISKARFKFQQKRLQGQTIEMAKSFAEKEADSIEVYQFAEYAYLKYDRSTNELLITLEGRIVEYYDSGYAFENNTASSIVDFFHQRASFSGRPTLLSKQFEFANQEYLIRSFRNQGKKLGISSKEEYTKVVNDYFFAERRKGFLLFTVSSDLDTPEFVGLNLLDGYIIKYSFDTDRNNFYINSFKRLQSIDGFVRLLFQAAGENPRI
jgi:hypothetical protein